MKYDECKRGKPVTESIDRIRHLRGRLTAAGLGIDCAYQEWDLGAKSLNSEVSEEWLKWQNVGGAQIKVPAGP